MNEPLADRPEILVHHCPQKLTAREAHGPAVTDIDRDEQGRWWASNGEYATRIPYCPWCGELLPEYVWLPDG